MKIWGIAHRPSRTLQLLIADKFIFAAIEVATLVPHTTSLDGLKSARAFPIETLNDLGGCINDLIDFDESVIEGKVTVKQGVEAELDEMKVNEWLGSHHHHQISSENVQRIGLVAVYSSSAGDAGAGHGTKPPPLPHLPQRHILSSAGISGVCPIGASNSGGRCL